MLSFCLCMIIFGVLMNFSSIQLSFLRCVFVRMLLYDCIMFFVWCVYDLCMAFWCVWMFYLVVCIFTIMCFYMCLNSVFIMCVLTLAYAVLMRVFDGLFCFVWWSYLCMNCLCVCMCFVMFFDTNVLCVRDYLIVVFVCLYVCWYDCSFFCKMLLRFVVWFGVCAWFLCVPFIV